MPTGRPAGLSIDAFVKLMAEMGVEAVPLPDSEQETVDAEATQAGSDRRVAWGRRLRKKGVDVDVPCGQFGVRAARMPRLGLWFEMFALSSVGLIHVPRYPPPAAD